MCEYKVTCETNCRPALFQTPVYPYKFSFSYCHIEIFHKKQMTDGTGSLLLSLCQEHKCLLTKLCILEEVSKRTRDTVDLKYVEDMLLQAQPQTWCIA